MKRVKHMAEDGRVAVRNARRDGRKHLDGLEKGGGHLRRRRRPGRPRTSTSSPTPIEGDIDKALADKEQELLEV